MPETFTVRKPVLMLLLAKLSYRMANHEHLQAAAYAEVHNVTYLLCTAVLK
jgi:hypothetical protein